MYLHQWWDHPELQSNGAKAAHLCGVDTQVSVASCQVQLQQSECSHPKFNNKFLKIWIFLNIESNKYFYLPACICIGGVSPNCIEYLSESSNVHSLQNSTSQSHRRFLISFGFIGDKMRQIFATRLDSNAAMLLPCRPRIHFPIVILHHYLGPILLPIKEDTAHRPLL